MEPEVLCTLITRFKRISSRVKICLKGGKRKKGKGRKEEQSWPRYSRITPGAWYKATEYGPRNKYEGNQACSSAYLLITQKIITHLARAIARGSKKWDFAWMITPVAWIFYRRGREQFFRKIKLFLALLRIIPRSRRYSSRARCKIVAANSSMADFSRLLFRWKPAT